ncbi:MAG TPA: hypothetical protein VFE33_11830, partial [Thermoanaerobaculia bacterium]|nr:hypothetical protein [Thermoanaerobaculia bacterium]
MSRFAEEIASTCWRYPPRQRAEALPQQLQEELSHALDLAGLTAFHLTSSAAFLSSFLQPFSQSLFEHGDVLQHQRLGDYSARVKAPYEVSDPGAEVPPEVRLVAGRQEHGELGRQGEEIRGSRGLELEEGGDGAAGPGQLFGAQPLFVDEEIGELRLVDLGAWRYG